MARTAFGKYLDPISIYDAAPRLWDFVLLTVLLFYVIKKSMVTARALREQMATTREKGLLGAVASAFGGERKMRETDNMISFIIALIMAIGLMRYGNVSLKFVFTSGILPGFAALMIGFGTYSFFLGMFGKEQKLVAIGAATFIGMGVFAGLRVAAGGDYEWMYVVFWFVALLVLMGIMKGFEGKAPDASRALEGASGDVNDLIRATGDIEKRFVGVDKRFEDAQKNHNSLLETLKQLQAAIASGFEGLKAAAAAGALVAGAAQTAAALPPTVETRPAIVQRLTEEGVPKPVAEAAAEQVAVAPAPVAPPVAGAPIPPADLKPAGPAPEGMVISAEVTFENVPPAEAEKTVSTIIDEVKEEFSKRRKQFGPVPAKSLIEASIKNYVEYGKYNVEKLYAVLTKQGSKQDAASFLDYFSTKAMEAYELVHGKPKPAAPPKPAAKAAPPAKDVKPPKKEEAQVVQISKSRIELMEAAETLLLKQIQRFLEISQLLEKFPPDVQKLIARNKKVQIDISQLDSAARKLVETASKPDFQSLLDEAKALQAEIVKLAGTYNDVNKTFEEGIRPVSSLINTDTQSLKKLVEELNSKFAGLKKALEDMKAISDKVRQGGVTNEVIEQYKAAFLNVERLIAEVISIFEHHGTPEALRAGLEGFVGVVQNYPGALKNIASEIKTLQARWSMVNDQMAELEKGRKEEEARKTEKEKASQKALIDMDKIIDQFNILQTFVSQIAGVEFSGAIKAPVSTLSKSVMGKMRDAADEANKIIIGLKNERVRINDIPTKTAAMNKLLQALADFTGGDFSKSISDVWKSLSSAAGMGAERGNKLITPSLIKFQQAGYSSYLDAVKLQLTTIKDELAKEAAPA